MELTIKPKLERTNAFSIYDIQEELHDMIENDELYISDGCDDDDEINKSSIITNIDENDNYDNTDENNIITDPDGFTYSKAELTDDGVLNIEAQLRRIKYLDDKQNILIRDYATNMKRKVLSICLHKLGLDIMTNTYSLKQSKRNELQDLMWEYNGKDEETINKDFYKACLDQELFDRDYTKYPIYN